MATKIVILFEEGDRLIMVLKARHDKHSASLGQNRNDRHFRSIGEVLDLSRRLVCNELGPEEALCQDLEKRFP